MPSDSRLVWLDALRLLAGVSMVGLHATADPSGGAWAAYDANLRAWPLLLRAVIYIARTELFIIISLFLLLLSLENRTRSYSESIREQARRLLPPFLFWCVFFAFYNLIKANTFGYWDAVWAELSDPTAWAGYVLLGSVKYHMHFIPTLFGVILMYPLFRVAVKVPALGLAVLFCLMVKRELDSVIFSELWGSSLLPFAARTVKIATYAGYGLVAASCVGLWQRAEVSDLVLFVPLIAFAGVLLFCLKLVATCLTIETGAWQPDYLPGYWADFLMPCLLFLGVMAIGHWQWPAVLSQMAPFAFGIYLCHPIFMDLAEIALRDTGLQPITQVFIKVTVALSGTTCLVLLLRRIRLLAWTIGLGPLPRPSLFSRPAPLSE